MSLLTGCFLVPNPKGNDKGLWFIFHHESDGVLAIDLTTEHPDIPYRHFEAVCEGQSSEHIVLMGGALQADSALIILHNDTNRNADSDSHKISDDFFFLSRRFVLLPGKPPAITNADNQPSRIDIAPSANFVVSIGFRLWNMDDLENELKEWRWNILPASPEIVFYTKREDRLKRAQLSIN